MMVAASIVGFLAVVVLLLDIFKAVVLARRTRGEFRLTRLFYRSTWPVFAAIGRKTKSGRRRETFLGVYGPLSLILLFLFWALAMMFSFALIRYGASGWDPGLGSFPDDLYQSAASFLTIGAGEMPQGIVRWINVIEAGIGFSYLALVIGYLPVFYQSFARRELHISMLDARAGSPPSAGEIIARHGKFARQLQGQLSAWEEWAADLMQDELSYPMLAYFRSQHLNQSWVSTLVAITDTSALISLSADDELRHQAEATFAMGRHAIIDSARVLGIKPQKASGNRLNRTEFGRICAIVRDSGAVLDSSGLQYEELLRAVELYEPYSNGLSAHLLMALPAWISQEHTQENWRIAARNPPDIFAVSDPFQDEQDKSA